MEKVERKEGYFGLDVLFLFSMEIESVEQKTEEKC